MPELPEVETIKRALSKAVLSCTIKKIVVNNNRFRVPIPDDFSKIISGAKIKDVLRIAKYIIIKLDNGYSIIWHLGMSGKIKICESTPKFLEKHDHVVIETDKVTLIYNDARRFGLVTYEKTSNLKKNPLLSKIGPEPFDERITGKYLFGELKNKKIPIKVALLDQSIINGVGNIYASEALFKARISPLRESASLSLKECSRLLESVKEILMQAIDAGGSTLRDYKKPDGSMGYFQNLHCVYNKTGQRCVECTCDVKKTGGIKKVVQAGRSTFYCPVKQR